MTGKALNEVRRDESFARFLLPFSPTEKQLPLIAKWRKSLSENLASSGKVREEVKSTVICQIERFIALYCKGEEPTDDLLTPCANDRAAYSAYVSCERLLERVGSRNLLLLQQKKISREDYWAEWTVIKRLHQFCGIMRRAHWCPSDKSKMCP